MAPKDEPDWLASLLVQVGKTKIFIKGGEGGERVIHFLEKPRLAARGKAAYAIQRHCRRRLLQRVALLRLRQTQYVVRVREALDAPDADRRAATIERRLGKAMDELDELSLVWDTAGLLDCVSPSVEGRVLTVFAEAGVKLMASVTRRCCWRWPQSR